MIYKYERVNTRNQSVGIQEMILDKLGIAFDKAYIDKISGKGIDRPVLNKLKLDVNEGDTIYCESISRLGRNEYNKALQDALTREKLKLAGGLAGKKRESKIYQKILRNIILK